MERLEPDALSGDATEGVAQVVDAVGTERFDHEIYQFAARHVALFSLFAIDLDPRGVRSHVIISEAFNEDLTLLSRKAADDYVKHDYGRDEILASRMGLEPGRLEIVRQRASDRNPDYRRKYFDEPEIGEVVSIFVGQKSSTLYIGLASVAAGFQESEVRWLANMAPLIVSLVRKHVALADVASGSDVKKLRERKMHTLKRMLGRFDAGLSSREIEVCAALVAGYTSEAIASNLAISRHTVATHRKRAYAKLHISSQAELFSLLFQALLP